MSRIRGERYEVTRSLGVGSQGETFEALDHQTGELVALKRFDVNQARAWKDVELAERETRVIASLRHPMIPRYVEHFEEDGALYLAMERIPGEPLSKLLDAGERFSEAEIIRLLRDCAIILAYLHGLAPPVIHRDIKPGNVLRRPDGSFALVDFGAVRDKLRPKGGSTIVGTFGYMAPEQFQGRAGPASDVYGVAATAVAIMTGLQPEDLPHKGLAIDVAAAAPRGMSPALVRAIARMLEPDPERRPPSIAAVLDELHAFERPSAPPPPSAPDPDALAPADRKRVVRELRRIRRAARLAELPLPVRILFTVGLVIGRLAVILTLGGVVVALLYVLSLLLGAPLARAAAACMATARRADRAMQRAQAYLGGHVPAPHAPVPTPVLDRARVRPSAGAPAARGRTAPPDLRTRAHVESGDGEPEPQADAAEEPGAGSAGRTGA